MRKGAGDLEDYGYLLEEVVLHATGLGLGTCWLGGTFTRSTFTSRFGGVGRDETIPAVVSIGYPGDDGAERIREREEGTRRLPAGRALLRRRVGRAARPRARGRLRRRARGRPHGAVGDEQAALAHRAHAAATGTSTCVRTKGYGKGSPWFKLLRIADLQRVDLGIAMCHFDLVARESGRDGRWVVEDPGLATSGPGHRVHGHLARVAEAARLVPAAPPTTPRRASDLGVRPPSCSSMPSRSATPQCSTALPSENLITSITSISIVRPVGRRPRNGSVFVARARERTHTVSESARIACPRLVSGVWGVRTRPRPRVHLPFMHSR